MCLLERKKEKKEKRVRTVYLPQLFFFYPNNHGQSATPRRVVTKCGSFTEFQTITEQCLLNFNMMRSKYCVTRNMTLLFI